MTETIKVNLDRAWLFLRITGTVAGTLLACFVAYNQLDQRMDNLEKAEAVKQAKLEYMEKEIGKVGVKLDKILDRMMTLSNGGHVAKKGR